MRLNLLSVALCMLCMNWTYAQTTVSTNHINNNGSGSVMFYVQNTNAFDIIITGVNTHLGTNAANNIQLLYNTVPYNDLATPWGFGTVGAGQNGWILAGTNVVASNTANGVVPALTGLSLLVPAGATYQLGVSATTIQYMTLTNGGGANINTFSGGGVNLITGDGISWGGVAYPSTPGNYPRGFVGSITFISAAPCVAPPTAGVVSAASNPICPSLNNNLSITGGTGGTGQTYQWQSSTNGTTFSNIVGATGSSYVSNQTMATYYRYYTTCGGMTDTSAALLVNTSSFLDCYCASSANNTGDEEIYNVTLNGESTNTLYSNVNGCTNVAPGPGSILSRYSNFKTLAPLTSVLLGQNVSFAIDENECDGATYFSCGIAVWVDFNQNGVFTDAGEQVYVENTTAAGPRTAAGSFTIPSNATTGITAMRIVCAEGLSGATLLPCGTYGYGETEDFLVELVSPPVNDAGIATLVSPTLPIAAGFSPVIIEVGNFGTDPLASFTVEWELNNIPQTSVPYQGLPIAPGATTNMTLANINFPLSTTSLHFWTTMPNGVPDERVTNDTLLLEICPGLSGTYTVGTAFSDYATPAEAINALMTCGVNGPVTMNFHSQTYTGSWTIGEIPGASAVNTVTFDGQGGTVTHNGSGSNTRATIILDGVDYLTIKNFTIQSTGASAAYGVLFINAADHNILENNNITVATGGLLINVVAILASASYDISVGLETEGNNANWNIIRNNEISGGNSVIILEGGLSNSENIGNQIIGNNIHTGLNNGIFVDEQDSLVISGNHVHNILATTSDAIVLNDVHHYAVLGNEVNSRDYGIAIIGGTAFGDQASIGLVANNMVTCAAGGEALYVLNASILYVYHNTLSGAPAVYMDNQSGVDLRNNIFASSTSYCVNMIDPIVSTMDYNLYYVSGSGSTLRFGSTIYPTLPNWLATGFGYDAHSIAGNPNFVNGLHIGSAIPMDTATAALVVPILVDIDGDPRPMGPKSDIGADERSSVANDAMAAALVSPSGCGSAAHDVIVSIANVGGNTLVSSPVQVNISGAATATFNTTLPLLTVGTTLDVNVGTINTEAGGTFNFEIIVSSSLDNDNSNDTLRLTVNILPSNQFALAMVGDTMVCEGLVATMAASASYAPATIHWYDAAMAGNLVHIGNSFTTPVLTSPIVYYAEIDGCNSPRAMMTINVDTMGINVELGPDQTACGGNTADIVPIVTISPAVSIVWSDGIQFPILEVSNTGMYYATVTNMFGCTHTDSVMVTVSPMPMVSDSVTNIACGGTANGAIDITVAGGNGPYSYMWSNSTTTEDLAGLSGGFYEVTVYDNGTASNCPYIYYYEVTEPSTIFVNVDATNSSCSNLNGTIDITVLGGTGNYTFLWSNGDTLEDIMDVNAGINGGVNTVTITDGNGCTTVTSTTMAFTNSIGITVDTIYEEILQIQGGIEISASGGSGNFQYVWSTGATTQDLTGLNAGTYSVTVVDIATGCQTVLSNIIVPYKNPISVDQILSLNSFNLYPNPTEGRVWVNMTLTELMDVQLEILNITGQVLQSFEPRQSLEQNYEINLSDYPSGVYLARFIVGREVMTHKIIVE